MSWHQTIIVGNLGGDPELRYMQNGRAVCNFSVAVSERWRDRQTNEQQERTTWYRVAVWGPQAENCNTYLAKGRRGPGDRQRIGAGLHQQQWRSSGLARFERARRAFSEQPRRRRPRRRLARWQQTEWRTPRRSAPRRSRLQLCRPAQFGGRHSVLAGTPACAKIFG